jgi:hypothetical protein
LHGATDDFVYAATDSSSHSQPITVSLTVAPSYSSPVANPDGYSTSGLSIGGVLSEDAARWNLN